MGELSEDYLFFLLSLPIIVHAASFIFYPLSLDLTQVSPPLTVEVINTQGSTGANQTSAVINITASTQPQSLITNPDFSMGADSWYYTTNDKKLIASWLDSDGVAQGLILVRNNTGVSEISDSILYLYQNFTVPEAVSSVNYEITYRLASEPIWYNTYLYLGVYDWGSGSTSWIINGKSVSTSNSYTTDSGSASISLNPGDTYALVIGVRLYQILDWYEYNFYFMIDSVNLTYTPSVIRYENDVLGIKTNGNYSIKFVIDSITGGSNTDVNLTLSTSTDRDTIRITNGTPNKTETAWLSISYGNNSLYYDGRLYISEIASETNTSILINGKLEYVPENDGVRVDYPITINLTS